jgi:hypothetical protein
LNMKNAFCAEIHTKQDMHGVHNTLVNIPI